MQDQWPLDRHGPDGYNKTLVGKNRRRQTMFDGRLTKELRGRMPLHTQTVRFDRIEGGKTGLVIVDEVNGFCKFGNLAPYSFNPSVMKMITNTDKIAREFTDRNSPAMIFLDTHEQGVLEQPYPPHCEIGSGEEELVSELSWLLKKPGVWVIKKYCINGFVGAITSRNNHVVDWVNSKELESIVVVGICTDICVMQFVQTMLSARNHKMMPTLKDVIVWTEACATYDLPLETVQNLDLPDHLAHPMEIAHHMGLYYMQASGAILMSDYII